VLRAIFGDHARRRVDEAIPPLARGEALQPDRDYPPQTGAAGPSARPVTGPGR
jgi:hypothetical protein